MTGMIIRDPQSPQSPTPVDSHINLSPKRALKVSESTMYDYDVNVIKMVALVAREWEKIAEEKMKAAYASGVSGEIFSSLKETAQSMAECMEKQDRRIVIWDSIFICEDLTLNQIQAIALTNVDGGRERFEISSIITHPQNVRSTVNQEETTRVEGAATAIFKYIVASERELLSRIHIKTTTLSAIPFFRKLGFELHEKNRPLEIPMSQSSDNFCRLLSLTYGSKKSL